MKIKAVVVALVVMLVCAGNSWGQVEEPAMSLYKQGHIYINFAQDFLEMGKSLKAMPDERQLAINLNNTAISANDYLWAAGDLLRVYDMISNPADKAKVRPFINKRLDSHVNGLELNIKEVNLSLPDSKNSRLKATAVRLRDELRKGQDLLKSAKIK
jgi:hypothetical protein